MSRPLVACDLDRTLIYSAKALHLDGPDQDAPRLVVSEVYENAPLSYMTRVAEDLLHELDGHAVLVPVTTRTQAQFARVQLPATPYAITTNGGVLLHHGTPDGAWSARVRGAVGRGSAPIGEVLARLCENDPPWVERVRTAEDLFAYAIVNRAALPDEWLAELTDWCAGRGWIVSLQGRKLYCVPAAVTKEAAVAEVMDRTGSARLIAAGDSLLDRGLLELADVALRPRHGELEAVCYTHPGLQVTDSAGVLAGEEILRAALEAARVLPARAQPTAADAEASLAHSSAMRR
ncbi:HAD family hydrolase [Sinomonas atrocyanea]|uniref:HAD family hydrolase n=1 Tax=Sinomonas atrocyanea TaxID=37927 RepID=UPI002786A4CC|nr:HAD family hydrolase [Sinomonas atrocyanea]MDQ0260153.1 hypothetical protein [Sinomonas atrocyanea]MDR6620215.1 hypothetical protein [Sinomonas atrocyanea]